MDSATLVDSEISDGRELLSRLESAGVDCRAACWLKPTETGRWNFYVATPLVDSEREIDAYLKVLGILREMGDCSITSSNLELVGVNAPVALEAEQTRKRLSIMEPTRLRVSTFGRIAVEDAIIYPRSIVEVPLYGSYFKGQGALTLSFEPFPSNSTLTVSKPHGSDPIEYPAVSGLLGVVAAPEGSSLDRDDYGNLKLAWQLRSRRELSTANNVYSLALLGMHGFRFIRPPRDDGFAFYSK
jgi:hypothetical protein